MNTPPPLHSTPPPIKPVNSTPPPVPTPTLTQNSYPEPEPEQERRRSLLWLWLIIGFVALGGIGTALYFILNSQNEESPKEVGLEEAPPLVDAEALMAAERLRMEEEARAAFFEEMKIFQTPDLALLDLHGRVQAVSADGWNTYPASSILDAENGMYTFSYDGMAFNRHYDENVLRYNYDDEGYLTSADYQDVPGYPTLELTWSYNKKLRSRTDSFGSHGYSETFTYDADGVLTRVEISEVANMGYSMDAIVTYKVLETDEFGNWIKRSYEMTRTERYWDFDLDEEVSETTTTDGIEERQIIYYERQTDDEREPDQWY